MIIKNFIDLSLKETYTMDLHHFKGDYISGIERIMSKALLCCPIHDRRCDGTQKRQLVPLRNSFKTFRRALLSFLYGSSLSG